MNLLVRTDVPSQDVIAAIRAQISAIDSAQPITDVQTAEELIDGSRVQPRFTSLLIGVFAATALILAIIGVYGVLSYSVAQRTQEFGIRLALGAHRGDILRMVLRQGMLLAASGIAVGVCLALIVTRLLESALYETGARELSAFVVAPLIFLVVAMLASYLPARRAMRVDPAETLR
jgi:putative ABC transport system permease protein